MTDRCGADPIWSGKKQHHNTRPLCFKRRGPYIAGRPWLVIFEKGDALYMTTEKLYQALYDKMKAEQEEYRKWLLSLPPDEILAHAVEYSTREDILMGLKSAFLSPARAKALIKSPSPLDDIYDEWKNTETNHMDDIRDVMECCADNIGRAAREAACEAER
jgi:hypothetical protein